MRHLIISIVFIVSVFGGFDTSFKATAQFGAPTSEVQAPIRWSASARLTGEHEGVIKITATIESGWHLYGTRMPKEGPRPTEFKYNVVKGWSLSGKTETDKAPMRKHDAMFNAEVEYWEDKVVFTQRFKLDKKGPEIQAIKCSVCYMGCNDQTCLPPKTKEFTLKILPKK